MKSLLLLLIPAVSFADASLPSGPAPGKLGGWQGKCYAAFSEARSMDPSFANGVLYTGYTNQNPKFPWVEYQLKTEQYPARSNVYTAWAERSGIWGVRGWTPESFSTHPGEFMNKRSTKKTYGWVALRRIGELIAVDDTASARFQRIFQKAVDTCLAMEDV